jgi:hypothetical protein
MSRLNSIPRKIFRRLGYARVFRFARISHVALIRADPLKESGQSSTAMAAAFCLREPFFSAAKPARRGKTSPKPVAKGRHLMIPYLRWPETNF